MDQNRDVWIALPSRFYLLYGEPGVHGAMALPKDELSISKLLRRIPTQAFEGVPERHFVQAQAQSQPSVTSQMLIRQEKDPLGLF